MWTGRTSWKDNVGSSRGEEGASCQKQCSGASSVFMTMDAQRHKKGQCHTEHRGLPHLAHSFFVLASYLVSFSIFDCKFFEVSKKFCSF